MDTGDVLNQQVEKAIEEHWPKIQKVFHEKVGSTVWAGAKDEKVMKDLFIIVYKQLPFPVRLIVKQDIFVKYCFEHRDRFI